MKRKRFLILLVLLFIIFLPFTVFPQEMPGIEPEEAPGSLFRIPLVRLISGEKSPEAETSALLSLLGTWNIGLSGNIALAADSKGVYGPGSSGVPSSGVLFQQAPELTIRLDLLEIFRFESTITEQIDQSTFRFAYRSADQSFPQIAEIGNSRLGYGRGDDSRKTGNFDWGLGRFSSEITPASQSGLSLGFSHLFTNIQEDPGIKQKKKLDAGDWGVEALLRYEPTGFETVRYRGLKSQRIYRLDASLFIRRAFFLLPGLTKDTIRIFIASDSGSITDDSDKSYEELPTGNFSYSERTGILVLKSPAPEYALISAAGITTYTDANPIHTAAIEGAPALFLSNGTAARDWEMSGFYQLPESGELALLSVSAVNQETGIQGELVRSGGTIPDRTFSITPYPDNGYAELRPIDGSITADPLAGILDRNELHAEKKMASDFEILFIYETPASSYQIPSGLLPSSITVTRNGIPTGDFIYSSSGVIELGTPAGDSDIIEISYQSPTAPPAALSGIVTVNGLPFLNFTASGTLYFAWPIAGVPVTTLAGESAGGFRFRTSASFENDTLHAGLTATAALSNPDTSGIRRLQSFSTTGKRFQPEETAVLPAAPPSQVINGQNLSPSNRGALSYRDLHTGGFTNGIAGFEDMNTFPIDPDFTGPYPAWSSDSAYSGLSSVMEWSLPAGKTWVGSTIFTSDILPPRIEILMKGSLPGNVKLFLLAGKVSEDIDGDGILDRLSWEQDDTALFGPDSSGVSLRVNPWRRAAPTGEDRDDDGGLDRIQELYISPAATITGDDWTKLTFDIPESTFQQTGSMNGFSIILVKDPGTESNAFSGTSRIGGIHFYGRGFRSNGSGISTLSDISPFSLVPAADENITVAFPEVISRFYTSADSKSIGGVFLSGATGTPSASTWFTPVQMNEYETISWYEYVPSITATGSSPTITYRLSTETGGEYSWTIPTEADTKWHKITCNLSAGTIDRDGTILSSVFARTGDGDSIHGFTVEMSGISDFFYYIDEIHASRVLTNMSASIHGYAEISGLTGWELNGLSLVSDWKIGIGSSASADQTGTSQYPADFSAYASARFLDYPVALSATWNLQQDLNPYLTAGYQLGDRQLLGTSGLSDGFNYSSSSKGVTSSKWTRSGFGYDSFQLAVILSSSIQTNTSGSSLQNEHAFAQLWNSDIVSETVNVRFRQAKTSPLPLNDSPGIDSFISRGYSTYLPFADALTDTTYHADSSFTLGTKPVGLSLAGLGDYQRLANNRSLISWMVNLGIPIKPRPDITISLDYSRRYSADAALWTNGVYPFIQDDLNQIKLLSGTHVPVLTLIPLVDLFSPDLYETLATETGTLDSASWSGTGTITVARLPGSHPLDIIIPTKATLGYTRFVDTATTADSANFSMEMASTVLNLFGNLGSFPQFVWYETDSFLGSLKTTWLSSEQVLEIKDKIAINLFLKDNKPFISGDFSTEMSIFIPETLDFYVSSIKPALNFQFTVPFGSASILPIPAEMLAKDHTIYHNESIRINGVLNSTGSGSGMSLFLRHESKLLLRSGGSALFFIEAESSYKSETPSDSWRMAMNTRTGLQCLVSF